MKNMDEQRRSCDNCKFAVEEEVGFSNASAEGPLIYCMKRLNPGLPIDKWYGEEPTLAFAGKCREYAEGEPVLLLPDDLVEEIWKGIEDPEVRKAFANFYANMGE